METRIQLLFSSLCGQSCLSPNQPHLKSLSRGSWQSAGPRGIHWLLGTALVPAPEVAVRGEKGSPSLDSSPAYCTSLSQVRGCGWGAKSVWRNQMLMEANLVKAWIKEISNGLWDIYRFGRGVIFKFVNNWPFQTLECFTLKSRFLVSLESVRSGKSHAEFSHGDSSLNGVSLPLSQESPVSQSPHTPAIVLNLLTHLKYLCDLR